MDNDSEGVLYDPDYLFILLNNMKGSCWEQCYVDVSLIGDGWVRNFFQYPKRKIIDLGDYPTERFFRKKLDVPDYRDKIIHEFLAENGITSYIGFETYDCDSWSCRGDSIDYLYLQEEDFKRVVEPRLSQRPDLDLSDLKGINDPNRLILLGGQFVKQSMLKAYWDAKGASTHDERAWNIPDAETLSDVFEDVVRSESVKQRLVIGTQNVLNWLRNLV